MSRSSVLGFGGLRAHRASSQRRRRAESNEFSRLFVEVTEKDVGPAHSGVPPQRILEQLSTVHVKCSNADCRDGGVYLMPTILEMLEHREPERLYMEMCPGSVPSVNNKLMAVKCQNMFCIRIRLA